MQPLQLLTAIMQMLWIQPMANSSCKLSGFWMIRLQWGETGSTYRVKQSLLSLLDDTGRQQPLDLHAKVP